ncbi:MAG: Ig-like domain-containing protein [Treponema sp.]|jgi:hypothetical protein|nr:Ig-like domain-containing protein [Treponema sp.]
MMKNHLFAPGLSFAPGLCVFLMCLFCTCDILRDSPFEVTHWSPGEGYHGVEALNVSVVFSHEPDRASVERYFSLTADGNRVWGSFRWEENRVSFLPGAPLEENRDYVLAVGEEAHDTNGLSMDRKFEAAFTTRPAGSRPEITGVTPPAGGILTGLRTPLRVFFAGPVPLSSLQDHVTLNPAAAGSWSTGDGGKTWEFTPSEKWTPGQRYELEVSASLTGPTGLSMEKEFFSTFTAGPAGEKPRLLGAFRLDGEEEEPLEEERVGDFTENSGWEKDSRLKLVFSTPVDLVSLGGRLVTEEGPSLTLETGGLFSAEALFRLNEKPAWRSRFLIRLKAGVSDEAESESVDEHLYRIYVDGKRSTPPRLRGIRLPLAPGRSPPEAQEPAVYSVDDLFANLSLGSDEDRFPFLPDGVPLWIELYFDTAEGAKADPLSVMALFRVETTNNVLFFSPRSVETENFTFAEPAAGWETCDRVEIRGLLTNTVDSGVVSFIVGAGLEDSLGNKSGELFRISLLK